MKKFGKQLKAYRKKLNYTQEEMTKLLGGISIKTYQSWEQGLRKPLKVYQKMLIEKIEEKIRKEKPPGE